MYRLRVIAAALDTANLDSPFPGPTRGLVPVASVLDQGIITQRMLRGRLRDGWGRPILYWSDGFSYVVASFGFDGRPQFDYSGNPPFADIPKGWAGTDPSDDLLIVDGVVFRGPSSQSELLSRSMADLRSAGTAVESFAVDNNIYPGPVTPIDGISRIEHDVEPIYIQHLPMVDPWGHPYLFWSSTYAYGIISYGVDGQPDYPYATWGQAEFEALHTGETTQFGRDVIFVEGQFVQWPAIAHP